MEQIKSLLNEFSPISLKEMDSVKLMSRTDTKYIFHISRFEKILNSLMKDYKVLEINGNRVCSYETLYFDTKNLDLYMLHHNGRVNRHKVRCRRYVESDLYFLEIKHKNNKARTIKSRIKLDEIALDFDKKSKKFIKSITNMDANELVPVCWINYFRITLVNRNMQERLTLDLRLA
ncbi:MAG: polyphosphate polymerase domain-containing protein, partial [Bacteroidetes bacterium]|nr:polyphosphate polymerase domain-containing protein [Bacteroidota bacterium]